VTLNTYDFLDGLEAAGVLTPSQRTVVEPFYEQYLGGETPVAQAADKSLEAIASLQTAVDRAVTSGLLRISGDPLANRAALDAINGQLFGDGYLVPNAQATLEYHVWTGSSWLNAGPLRGPKGDTGGQGQQGIQGLQGLQGIPGPIGERGWTSVLASVVDGERRVHQVVDWVGGTGAKPAAASLFVGAAGFVGTAAAATDIRGPQGATGASGSGSGDVVGPAGGVADGDLVAFGGPTGKIVRAITKAAARTWLALTKADVGLGSVDNTADAQKPVSTAQQTALNAKFDKAGGTLTGPLVSSYLSPFLLFQDSGAPSGSTRTVLQVFQGGLNVQQQNDDGSFKRNALNISPAGVTTLSGDLIINGNQNVSGQSGTFSPTATGVSNPISAGQFLHADFVLLGKRVWVSIRYQVTTAGAAAGQVLRIGLPGAWVLKRNQTLTVASESQALPMVAFAFNGPVIDVRNQNSGGPIADGLVIVLNGWLDLQ
jgi:hypothetical protein